MNWFEAFLPADAATATMLAEGAATGRHEQ
jgi:hypothetical protein